MKSVLVTGSEGQLAKSIAEISSDYPELSFKMYSKESLDITQKDQIEEVLTASHFDFCINCAAYTQVEQAEKSPEIAFKINSEAVAELAELCQKHGVDLIHLSTDYVFDGRNSEGYKPGNPTNPINVYGRSKREGEIAIEKLMKRYYIVRTSWLYSDYGNNFYKTILQKAKQGERLKVTDQQTGCPTHARNLARFILDALLLGSRPYGTYHFTDGKRMTWYDFAKRILEGAGLLEKTELVRDANYRTFAHRPKYSVLLP